MAIYKFVDADELPPVPSDLAIATPLPTDLRQKRQIEREFGVPVPGEIQPVQLWTDTALKTMPQEKPLSFKTLFGRDAPVMLDIGCGNGRSRHGEGVRFGRLCRHGACWPGSRLPRRPTRHG